MPGEARSAVVIGGSAGAFAEVIRIVAALPEGFPAAVLIVLHFPPPSLLERIAKVSRLPVGQARNGAVIEAGRIYLAPIDRHVLVSRDRLKLSHGPRENMCRPAIDPTFRTAAKRFGARLTGVLLSGMQSDGAHGLAVVKSHGGSVIVQDPNEAEFPEMPRSAIEKVGVDRVLDVDGIVELLRAMENEQQEPMGTRSEGSDEPPEGQQRATLQHPPKGELSPFACPGCGGALWEQQEANVVRFRCHVGHAYTDDVLLDEQGTFIESAFWAAVRALEEKAELSRRLAKRAREAGAEISAMRHEQGAADADRQASMIYELLTAWGSPAQHRGRVGVS